MFSHVRSLYPRRFVTNYCCIAIAILGFLSTGIRPVIAQESAYGGVQIRTTIDPEMFPIEWRQSPINGTAKAISATEAERSTSIITRALRKYPDEILRKNLSKIFLVKSMSFYGVGYGGTNSLDTVYCCNDGERMGYTSRYIEQSFHHEFSSILLRNFPKKISQKDWLAQSPADFRYLGDGVQAIKQTKDSIQYDPRLYADGFLMEYGKASFEEDFNTIAEGLLLGDAEYWKAIDSSARLKKKCGLAVQFYTSLNPIFTEQYFRGFASTK